MSMRRVMLLALLSLALPTAALANSLANSTDPITINFTVVPIGGASTYTGATLDTSTSFNLGTTLFLVNRVGPGDQSGLTPGDTSITISSPISYGAGNSGLLASPVTKSWTDKLGTFSESFTSFTADRNSPNAITLDLTGTLTGPGGVTESIVSILSAGQAGGPGHVVNWQMTEQAMGVTPVPEPGPIEGLLLGAGFIGIAEMARRKLVPGT
jgi:hypothetical protein